MAAQINGQKVGACKRCHVVWFKTQRWTGYPEWVQIRSQWLLHLYKAYEDIVEKGLKGKAVINMSFSSSDKLTPAAIRAFSTFHTFSICPRYEFNLGDGYLILMTNDDLEYILDKLDKEQDVVLVAAAGNLAETEGKEITRYPARFGSPSNPFGQIKNLIVVGATTGMGYEAVFSQTSTYLTTYAPGEQIWVPTDPAANPNDPWKESQGTSLGT